MALPQRADAAAYKRLPLVVYMLTSRQAGHEAKPYQPEKALKMTINKLKIIVTVTDTNPVGVLAFIDMFHPGRASPDTVEGVMAAAARACEKESQDPGLLRHCAATLGRETGYNMAEQRRAAGPVIDDMSPWGLIETIIPISAGITSVSTLSHGGIHLAPKLLRQVPENYRRARWGMTMMLTSPWFEQDVDWCLVAKTFPEAFNARARKDADIVFEAARRARIDELAAMHSAVAAE